MRSRRHHERGVALLLGMFALMLLSGIALGLMFMSDTDTNINRNYRDAEKAYLGAVAGLQEGFERLSPTAADLITAPSTLPATAAATGVVYIINPDASGAAIHPWDAGNAFFDDELCHENFPSLGLSNVGARTPCPSAPSATYYSTATSSSPYQGTSGAMAYRWVRITQKVDAAAVPDTTLASSYYVDGSSSGSNTVPICWDGQHQLPLPAGYATCNSTPPTGLPYLRTVYRLTALAAAGGARRMAQMEAAQDPPFVTNASIDSQDHVTLNGALLVNGYDYCNCQCTTDVHGNVTCVDRSGMSCDRSRWAIFAANNVDQPTGSETIVAGQNPPIARNQSWPYDITALINKYKSLPNTTDARSAPYNFTCAHSDTALNGLTCGTSSGQSFGVPPAFPPNPPDNPAADPALGTPQAKLVYVPGNVQLTGGSKGNGVLIVDGDLDIHGGLQFYGLILVRGVIKFTGGGSDHTNIYGAILAGQESMVDNVLGGSASIYFNSCALSNAATLNQRSLVQLSFHEVMY